MNGAPQVRRVILVVLDGLRPDAITSLPLPTLLVSGQRGAHTWEGTTVTPSITTAAITSLLTGVPPSVHRVRSDRIGLPLASEPLTPIPRLLRQCGHSVAGFMATVPRALHGLAARLAAHAGAAMVFEGRDSQEILDRAIPVLRQRTPGLTFLHWPDADIAGHAHGWMSAEYLDAARQLDRSFERLLQITEAEYDVETVIIAVADHGGGGESDTDHSSDHPLDVTIPIFLVGGRVATMQLDRGTSLLDLPATIAWLLGATVPAGYRGRALREALRLDAASSPAQGAAA